MRLLVLGGTKFLGRHLVEQALARGHEVTTFTRGLTNPGLFDGVEELRGDRDGGLDALAEGRWEACVDTSGYYPRVVRQSAELLRDRVGHYTFVSSISAYADFRGPLSEDSPLATLEDETVEEMGAEFQNYGGLKALCERVVQDVFGDRALIVRPGLIVGPHDPTGRFTYWARRLREGGPILAPGPPGRKVQFVDVRDLVAWMVALAERRVGGVFNATNEGVAWGELLAAADVVWADDGFLLERGVGEWMELPLWVADSEMAGIHQADVSRAVGAGLQFRPIDETIRDTADWDAQRTDRGRRTPTGVGGAGMAYKREQELLAELGRA
jgi:2'-hydroxyisoflavone reductase